MVLARDIIFRYLHDLGVTHIFGVPGTNEIPIIDGTSDPEFGISYIPCLHENIAMGAATGYSRMTGKPGVVELHVTPGAGHGIGNLFNAYKSHSPVVVLCGQQHSQLLLQEPLLYSQTVELAEQYTKWAYEVRSPDELPMVMQRALKVALAPPAGPVFVSIPWDFMLQDVVQAGVGRVTRIARHFTGDRKAIAAAVERLAAAHDPIIVVGDGVGYAGAWEEIEVLATQLGAPVYSEQLSSMMNYPNSLYQWQGELPGKQRDIQQRFEGHDVAFMCGVGAQAQLVVFNYADGPLIPDDVAQVWLHDDPWEIGKNHFAEVAILGGIKATLPLITEGIGSHRAYDAAAATERNGLLQRLDRRRTEAFEAYAGGLSQANALRASSAGSPPPAIQGEEVARLVGEIEASEGLSLVYVHEAISDAVYFQKYLHYPTPVSYYSVEGGSLGYSMPAALGIKSAVGDSHLVVNAIGDGSTLFYPQCWWTASRFDLPILTLILNNREYKTLLAGLDEITNLYGWKPSGDPWYLRLDEPPAINFPEIAASFGVTEGAIVSDPAELRQALLTGIRAVQAGNSYVLQIDTDPSLAPPAGAQQPTPRLDVFYAHKEGRL